MSSKDATATAQAEQQIHAGELERQQLTKHAHSLISAIALRPGATKLLKGVMPMLEQYAAYKANRSQGRQH